MGAGVIGSMTTRPLTPPRATLTEVDVTVTRSRRLLGYEVFWFPSGIRSVEKPFGPRNTASGSSYLSAE